MIGEINFKLKPSFAPEKKTEKKKRTEKKFTN